MSRKGVAPLHPSNPPLFVADSRRQPYNAGRGEAHDDFAPPRGDPAFGRRSLLLCFRLHPGRNSFRQLPRSSPKPTPSSRSRKSRRSAMPSTRNYRHRSFPILDLGPKTDRVVYEGRANRASRSRSLTSGRNSAIKPPMSRAKSNRALSTISTGCSCLCTLSWMPVPGWKTRARGNCRSGRFRQEDRRQISSRGLLFAATRGSLFRPRRSSSTKWSFAAADPKSPALLL